MLTSYLDDMTPAPAGRLVQRRREGTRPRDINCPMALRRVCGVCENFAGTLRQEGRGRCDWSGLEVGPRRDAGMCRQWARKSVGQADD